MKALVLPAAAGAGRLIVRLRPGERPFHRGPVCSEASADLPGVDRIEGDARCEGALTCSLVVKGARKPPSNARPGGRPAHAAR